LGDIASRLGAAMVVLLGPDGSPIESWTESGAPLAVSTLVPFGEALEDQRQRIIDIDGVSYHTVMAALESRSTAAWIVLGFSIDEALARHLRSVTGLEVSFVSRSRPHRVIASTLDARAQVQFFATADLEPDTARLLGPAEATWWTLVKPVLER